MEPTPTARDWKDGYGPNPNVEVNGLLGRVAWTLGDVPLLPTPTSNQPGGTAEAHLARKARMPDGSLCWTTPRGIVQAMPGGEIRNIQEGKVKVDIKTDTTAGTTLIERDGLQQVVSTRLVRGSNSAMGVGSFMDAQIIRKGT